MTYIYKRFKSVITVLLFSLAPVILFGQSNISGIVRDEQKLPLPGVSITLAGGKGTTTDINGHYIIAAGKGQTLTFAFIGYTSQQITIADKNVIDVNLIGNTKTLNEVVVTALGVKKETRRIGYAIQAVNGDALTTARDPNPITGLVGKVAGLSVGPSAELLGNPNVLIRGERCFTLRCGWFPDQYGYL